MNGAIAAGADEIVNLGIAPTPTAQKIAERIGGLATIVVTASHNTFEYNGWKGMAGNKKLSKDEVAEISSRYWRQVSIRSTLPQYESLPEPSIEHNKWYAYELISDIEKEFGHKPLDGTLFVIDGANGASQKITPNVFRNLGAVVREFSCNNEGQINDGCGAADLSGLK